MTTLAIILVIISALFHAIRDFFTKKAHDKQAFIWLYEIVALIFFLPIVLTVVFCEGLPGADGFVIGFISGCVHFCYWVFLSKSYEKGDLSHVYPIIRSAPALVLVFAILFLKEEVSITGVIGILAVVFGVYTINLKGISMKNYLEPFRLLFIDKSTQFAFLTLLTVAAYSLLDKVGVGYVHPIIFVYLLTFFSFILFTPYLFRTKEMSAIKHEWNINKKIIIIDGVLVISGYALILIAFTFSNLSYVAGLRQFSIVFAVLLGGHMLKEKHKGIRLFGASIIFLGSFLIAIA